MYRIESDIASSFAQRLSDEHGNAATDFRRLYFELQTGERNEDVYQALQGLYPEISGLITDLLRDALQTAEDDYVGHKLGRLAS